MIYSANELVRHKTVHNKNVRVHVYMMNYRKEFDNSACKKIKNCVV